MFLSHFDAIKREPIRGEGVKNIEKQVLIGPDQGWEGQVMRRFTLREGIYSQTLPSLAPYGGSTGGYGTFIL